MQADLPSGGGDVCGFRFNKGNEFAYSLGAPNVLKLNFAGTSVSELQEARRISDERAREARERRESTRLLEQSLAAEILQQALRQELVAERSRMQLGIELPVRQLALVQAALQIDHGDVFAGASWR